MLSDPGSDTKDAAVVLDSAQAAETLLICSMGGGELRSICTIWHQMYHLNWQIRKLNQLQAQSKDKNALTDL